jgi:hypothetical protein
MRYGDMDMYLYSAPVLQTILMLRIYGSISAAIQLSKIAKKGLLSKIVNRQQMLVLWATKRFRAVLHCISQIGPPPRVLIYDIKEPESIERKY